MDRIDGRVAVVTGAASGIGFALAEALAAEGAQVVLADIEQEPLDAAVRRLRANGHRSVGVRTDVRHERDVRQLADATMSEFGAVHIVCNNAGVESGALFSDIPVRTWEWVMDVNFWGVIHGTRAYLPILIEQNSGVIVNTSSVFGLVGFPTQSAYCASKAAVKNYTESLRHELRGTGVGAIAVHPGGVATSIVDNARFHVDDRGNTDHEVLKTDFNKVARTSSDKAAAIIQRGVERGKDRILVGPDAYLLSVLVRAAPVRYYDVIKRLEPLIRR
jgi:NAD(P)-dependent dehydrogenase (short-subunit alcohol dehydrogenase family)